MMSKLLQYLVNKPSVQHKVLPGLRKMQMAGQYTAERDATSVNTPILSKMFGAQREVDVNKLNEDSFKQKYKMTPHQYKMSTDSDYAQAFERQMDDRRQNDPNYSEINLPATDVRSKLYRGNPNLALIPKGSTGPARAQQEQLFADMTSLSAPLLPVKSLVRGLQVGKAASAAPKIIDKLISTPPPRAIKTAATQSIDDSGLIINEDVYRQWSNARRQANIPEPSSTITPANIPSYMENWGTGNWNANINVPVDITQPYRPVWPTAQTRNTAFDRVNSFLSDTGESIDRKLGKFISKRTKGTNPPLFDPDEITRLINENLSKGVGVKKENLGLQVRNSPLPYDIDTSFRLETLIDNNKVGSILFQRNMNPYKPKKFSQILLEKLPTPFERWQNIPGFRKTNDFPFQDYNASNPIKDPTGKTFNTVNDLYNTGISGEFNKAINEALKAKGLGNVLSGGTGHSLLGEARWKKLVERGLAEDLGDGYFKLKKQGGAVILPKMQMAGQNNNLPQRVSINDPRYAELYKNRQVGSFYDGAYSLPDLDEVTVTGKDERVKEGMLQGSGRFYQGLAGVMGSPQTGLMEVITGKQQTPSQAWGFDTKGKSWYNPKSISNFAMDAVLDPMNALGVGLIDDVTRGAVRLGAKQAARRSANYLTTKTPLKNTYKYNPLALKDDDVEILQRWDFDNERNISLQSGVIPDEYTGRWYGSNWDNENLQRVHTSVPNYMQIRPGSGQIKTAVVRKGSADLPEEMTKPGFRSFYSQPDTERILPKDATFTSKRVDINPFDSPNDAVDYDETGFINAWSESRNLANEALPKPNWLTGYNSNVNRNVTNEILDNASNYLTTKTPLRNAYKINPWAFKPQEGMMYRGLGQEGYDDALTSGVFRPKQHNYAEKRSLAERVQSPKQFGSTYYAPAKKFKVIENYGPDYVAEVPFEGNLFNKRYGRKDWSWSTERQIPINEGRILQRDWLRRYTPVKENGGSIDLPKMQMRGQVNLPGSQTISINDPRYPEMYRNRQVGTYYDGAFTLPDLPEVTVTAPRSYTMDSLRNFTSAGLYGAPASAMKASMIPQAAMTEGIEVLRGKPYDFKNVSPNFGYFGSNQRDLSQTMGYKNPEGFLQNAINVGLSMIDPLSVSGLTGMLRKPLLRKLVNSSSKNLKSEINWAKWNKEIPKNKPLLQEYNAIEQQAKADGTWMKNSDGTPFDGTPEEFVQQNSSNFKKAYPDGAFTTYKGVGAQGRMDDLRDPDGEWTRPFFAGDKNVADVFTSKYHTSKSPIISHNNKKFNPDANPEVHKFIISKSPNSLRVNANSGHWAGFKIPENSIPGLSTITGTPELQRYIRDNALDYITIDDLLEGGGGAAKGTIHIINPRRNNIPKSAIGNNGMFDMTNLNIYKALVPSAIATGAISKQQNGGFIVDPRGQWAHPGKRTIVPTPTGQITMKGVPYPVYGQDETGFGQMMYPGGEYKFPGQMVDEIPMFAKGGQHGGLDRWFAEKWVDVKTGKACGRQEGESRAGYPACRPSKRVSSETPKTSSEMSSAEKAKFKRTKTSSERIPYNHKK